MQRILIVDDDPNIARLVGAYLKQSGFFVSTALDVRTAWTLLHQERPHLLILDVMLPDGDGFELTRRIRAEPSLARLPIIMLTARVEDTDVIVGLELGADDYMTKPFNPREVVTRVRTVLRRVFAPSHPETASLLRCGALSLDVIRREVRLNEALIDLTPSEFGLLQAMIESPGVVFTRAQLIERALGFDYESLERSLDTHIKNLRRKLGDDPRQPQYIQTVYGVGYKLTCP